jgi:hypothetical protein
MEMLRNLQERYNHLTPVQLKLAILTTVMACILFGAQGLIVPCMVLYMVGTIGLDRETLAWFTKIKSAYSSELTSMEPFEWDNTNAVASDKAAVKFALLATSRVGCLTPSVANRLVYETTLLRLFEEHNVRFNLRMDLLGGALVACFIRPKSYDQALTVIQHLSLDTEDAVA